MIVQLSRRELFTTALVMLPAFLIGEWLASLCGIHTFSFHDVWEGFWGVLTFAAVLAFTRSEQTA